MKRILLTLISLVILIPVASAQARKKGPPPDLVNSPFEPADISVLPEGMEHVDIFLLMGQSNMKGRGIMPKLPLNDQQIIMMHRRTDGWFLARHPLHAVGDPVTFKGADNAGVGPGLAFAQVIAKTEPKARIALIPCAVGGTAIQKWQKGQRLYEETIRRAKLALDAGPAGRIRIAGALWLQGEADSGSPETISAYPQRLHQMITDLRADLGIADLPFIVCTIGELKPETNEARAAINSILLSLPEKVSNTACIDSREFARDIGDGVHFDTATQEQHGRLYAAAYLNLVKE